MDFPCTIIIKPLPVENVVEIRKKQIKFHTIVASLIIQNNNIPWLECPFIFRRTVTLHDLSISHLETITNFTSQFLHRHATLSGRNIIIAAARWASSFIFAWRWRNLFSSRFQYLMPLTLQPVSFQFCLVHVYPSERHICSLNLFDPRISTKLRFTDFLPHLILTGLRSLPLVLFSMFHNWSTVQCGRILSRILKSMLLTSPPRWRIRSATEDGGAAAFASILATFSLSLSLFWRWSWRVRINEWLAFNSLFIGFLFLFLFLFGIGILVKGGFVFNLYVFFSRRIRTQQIVIT